MSTMLYRLRVRRVRVRTYAVVAEKARSSSRNRIYHGLYELLSMERQNHMRLPTTKHIPNPERCQSEVIAYRA